MPDTYSHSQRIAKAKTVRESKIPDLGCWHCGRTNDALIKHASQKTSTQPNIQISLASLTESISMTQAHNTSAIELQDLDHQRLDHSINHISTTEQSTTATSLPAADGGFAAWRLLIAAFVFEALLWGQSPSPA
jgi:hypothetical protein